MSLSAPVRDEMDCKRNFAAEYRVRKQREDQSREIIREIEERRATKEQP